MEKPFKCFQKQMIFGLKVTKGIHGDKDEDE